MRLAGCVAKCWLSESGKLVTAGLQCLRLTSATTLQAGQCWRCAGAKPELVRVQIRWRRRHPAVSIVQNCVSPPQWARDLACQRAGGRARRALLALVEFRSEGVFNTPLTRPRGTTLPAAQPAAHADDAGAGECGDSLQLKPMTRAQASAA